MSDDDGFPDPGQMTTRVAADRVRRATPRRAQPDDADDGVGPDVWPDPGQGSASPDDERRGRHHG